MFLKNKKIVVGESFKHTMYSKPKKRTTYRKILQTGNPILLFLNLIVLGDNLLFLLPHMYYMPQYGRFYFL